jgi:hypothetical protein
MQTARPKPPNEREPLAGLVERVTFHNADNGFCVLRVKARGHRDLVTVLGAAPSISAGEYIQASGSWENNREHGLQFRAAFLRATAPTSAEGMEKYLGSGLIKGIGPFCPTLGQCLQGDGVRSHRARAAKIARRRRHRSQACAPNHSKLG